MANRGDGFRDGSPASHKEGQLSSVLGFVLMYSIIAAVKIENPAVHWANQREVMRVNAR
jgi:hypothetical protein